MKKIIRNITICSALLLSFYSCSEDDLVINEELAKPQYILPKGEPGSIDARIYDIYEKYGTYIFYEFNDEDMAYIWTGAWTRWHTPANLSENKKYVAAILDLVEGVIINKFEPDFVRRTLPYKIYLVDTLSSNYDNPGTSTSSVCKYVNMQTSGQGAFAIANAGKKQDSFTASDWMKLEVELNALYTQNYYATLSPKPVDFIATRHPKYTCNILKDPLKIDDDYNYSCWMVGHIAGNPGYVIPKEDLDYADFVAFLTGTPATEITRRLTRYERLKTRTMVLVPYLNNVVGLNVIGTQNQNCPDDKLPVDYFDKLQ